MHRDGSVETVVVTGDLALEIDEIQYQTGEGPCAAGPLLGGQGGLQLLENSTATVGPISVSTPGATSWSTTRTSDVLTRWACRASRNWPAIRSPLDGSGEALSVQFIARAVSC